MASFPSPPLPHLDQPGQGAGLSAPRSTIEDGWLRIRSAEDAGHWTLELDGELDVSNASTLDEEIRRVEACAETLTIDLRGLSFMDTTGVLVIRDAHQRRSLKGGLRLGEGSRMLQSVFRLCGLEDVLPFER